MAIDPYELPPDPADSVDPDSIATNSASKLVVPGNILPWIESASDEFGVPRDLLAAVIYQHSHFTGLTPNLIRQVAARILDSYSQIPSTYPDDPTGDPAAWVKAAALYATGSTSSSLAQAYIGQISNVYGGTYSDTSGGAPTYHTATGITLGTDKALPSGKFTTARFPGGVGGTAAYGAGGSGSAGVGKLPIIPGLSDEDAVAVKSIADGPFLKYLARLPTTAEYVDLSKKRWTQQTLETHLRAQPVRDENGDPIAGQTLGRAGDIRDIANANANAILGRDASEAEINWLITNNIPSNPEHVSAFYQQIHDNAVWHGDPAEWRDAQKRVQSIWDSLGLTGKVDPNAVNAVVDQKLTDAQVTDQFRALPAPGYPSGVTVGEVERLRTVAAQAKSDLFPGESVTDSELHHLQGMSPDEILMYYRSIVPKDSKTGLAVGIEKDYRAMAKSVLDKYGVTGYDPTPQDLKFFALTQADPSTILMHYAENPQIAAQHPGLAYGMSTEQYKQASGDLQGAYGAVFPGQELAGPRAGANQVERQGNLIGYGLTNGISAPEFTSTLERFRQERGRAPTTTEFVERRTRPDTGTARDQTVEPQYSSSDVGPRTGRRSQSQPAI